jgi:hypothetical protein
MTAAVSILGTYYSSSGFHRQSHRTIPGEPCHLYSVTSPAYPDFPFYQSPTHLSLSHRATQVDHAPPYSELPGTWPCSGLPKGLALNHLRPSGLVHLENSCLFHCLSQVSWPTLNTQCTLFLSCPAFPTVGSYVEFPSLP